MYLETSILGKEHQSSNSNVSIRIQEQLQNDEIAKVKQNQTTNESIALDVICVIECYF